MAQRPPDRRDRDACVAAGRFDNRVVRLDAAFLISSLQNVKGHPVLNAAGHVEVFSLGINDSLSSSERKPNGKQWCVADHVLQLFEAKWSLADGSPDCRQRIDKRDE